MAKFEMIALKAHRYGSGRQQGDRYFIDGETDRRLMKALGNADDAPPAPPPKKYEPVIRAANPVVKKATEGDAPRRTAYQTRRLQAETGEPAAAADPVPGMTTHDAPTGDADA